MNHGKAVIQFLGYRVDKMNFVTKFDFEHTSEPIELEPALNRSIRKVNEDEYEVGIEVELKQDNLPFEAKLLLSGRFKCGESVDADKAMKVNAVAILYPYVRSTFSLMTTLGNISPVVLPTINLAQMFEREERDKQEKVLQ